MRIAVMGAGAVGAYFGAKLAIAGHDVAFIARGKHLAAMRKDGLTVHSSGGDLHIRSARFTADTEEVGKADLILFCVKSYDTISAAELLKPMIGDNTIILSLQNGVDNAEKIAQLWGDKRTLPGVVYIGAQIKAPAMVTHSAGGKIIFGQIDGTISAPANLVEQTLSAAGIPNELSTNIHKVQWSKLLWNAPFCAISCLARANMPQIVESEPLVQLALECMAEVKAAALTRGIDLPCALFDEAISFSRGLGGFKPSMLQDLEAGKPLEYKAFNGIVVNLLRQAGKAAPVNQSFYAVLEYLDRKIREEAIL